MTFSRITVNPEQMGGVPCVRGLCVPVATVVEMVAECVAEKEILRSYPDREPEDIREALRCGGGEREGDPPSFCSLRFLIGSASSLPSLPTNFEEPDTTHCAYGISGSGLI